MLFRRIEKERFYNPFLKLQDVSPLFCDPDFGFDQEKRENEPTRLRPEKDSRLAEQIAPFLREGRKSLVKKGWTLPAGSSLFIVAKKEGINSESGL